MSVDNTATTVLPGAISRAEGAAPGSTAPALMIAWSREEPHRVGEVALLPAGRNAPQVLLGRGEDKNDDPAVRLVWIRQRPGRNTSMPPLKGSGISRKQLLLRIEKGGVRVENIGRCPLTVRGEECSSSQVRPGEALCLDGQLVLLCVRRPKRMPASRSWPQRSVPVFGEADPHGFVGESSRAWELRDHLAFLAGRNPHVLVLGESGSGKELAAKTIHALSRRASKRLVARNAATLPAGLVDAELFGNVKDYPNPGMRERAGLIGQADGSTLFLDEIAELPERLQGHLLRVLDSEGDYQRLGEDRNRKADLRLIAATNRSPSDLKHDLLARLRVRIQLPGLDERADDIPLLARHLLRSTAEDDPEIAERFFDEETGEPRLEQDLVLALLEHRWTHHVRELDALLWAGISGSRGHRILLTREVRRELDRTGTTSISAVQVSPEMVQACLDKHEGVRERVWRELGLKNRWVLNRLIKKHGLRVGPPTEESGD